MMAQTAARDEKGNYNSKRNAKYSSALSRWVVVTYILTAVAGFTNSAYAAGRVFFDNFESGTTSAWTQDSYHNKCGTASKGLDGGTPHTGAYMAMCNWNGVVAWNDPAAYSSLELPSWNYNREFLIRYWVRYDADCDSKFGAKAFRLYPNNGTESYYWGAQLESSGGPLFSYWEEINGSAGPLLYGTLPLDNGKWHKFEIYVLHNTAGRSDGVLRVWVDGVLQQQLTNGITSASGARWYPMYFMSNWSDNGPEWAHDANNHTYWDNVEIFSDLGTGASGSMSDASIQQGGSSTPALPASPTNLQVR